MLVGCDRPDETSDQRPGVERHCVANIEHPARNRQPPREVDHQDPAARCRLVWEDVAASLDGSNWLVANQINRARKVAERLGKRHGVPSQIARLTFEQRGPGVFYDAGVATLLMSEGVYLLAMLAEYPDVVPASSPKAARMIARRVTRNLRSPGAERPSIFLAHAILRYGASSYQEFGDDSTASAMTTGLELLARHYPMPGLGYRATRSVRSGVWPAFRGSRNARIFCRGTTVRC